MAAPSFQDFFNAGRAEAINRRPDLTFDEGDVSEFFVAAAAAMADHLTGFFAGRFKATYLDGAEGDDLTTLALDHWNVARLAASAAVGSVKFTRTNANGAPGGTIPAGTVVSTQQDALGNTVQFTTNVDLNFAGGALGPSAVAVTCTTTGPGGDVAVNTITKIVGSVFDNSFTVNNPDGPTAGGADQEADDDLRERVRNVPSTLRRATLAALEHGALGVAGVARATAVEEVDTLLGGATGIVDLYVTDSSGNSNAQLQDAVATEIVKWRAAGIVVNVVGGLLQTQNISVVLTVRLGTDTVALGPKVIAAITSRVNKLKIGETLSPDLIKQAALNVDENILSVAVTNPSVAVVPPAGTIIRAGTVTVS